MSRITRQARIYNILVKSHKLTVVHTALPPTMKMGDVKEETLSALKADVARDALDVHAFEPPEINAQNLDDFELCRAVKGKATTSLSFEVLDPNKSLRDSGISGWETVFVQFQDPDTGNLIPITYVSPPMNEGEEELVTEADRKGKRKASDELDELEASLDF